MYGGSQFCDLGDLLTSLRSPIEGNSWTIAKQRQAAADIASGMVHVAHHKIVHRDLAARNILLQSRGGRVLAKISDLGLSRQVTARDSHYVSTSAMRPIRWTAPEALQESRFSTASDVWSFGVLYWEILSRGAVPYGQFPEHDNAGVVRYVEEGGTLPRPDRCPAPDFALIQQCMSFQPERRLTFQAIFAAIDGLLRAESARPAPGSPGRLAQAQSYELMPIASVSSRAELIQLN